MKRILSVAFCVLILMSYAACSEKKDSGKNEDVSELSDDTPISQEESDEEISEVSEPEVSYSFEDAEYHEELPEYMKNNPVLYSDLLEKAIKLYYSGIITGKINNDTYMARFCRDKLPEKDDSPETRKKLADLCTVGGALEYFGCDCREYTKYYEMYNGCLKYFSCDSDGYIYYYEKAPRDTSYRMNSMNQTLFFIFKNANIDKIEREASAFAAEELDQAVSEYYSGIISGKITSSFKGKYTSDILPKKNSSSFERLSLAGDATVAGAADHAGFFTVLYPYIKKIGYNKRTHAITSLDQHDHDVAAFGTDDVKLSQIFGSAE